MISDSLQVEPNPSPLNEIGAILVTLLQDSHTCSSFYTDNPLL